jgi:hypothetical protein
MGHKTDMRRYAKTIATVARGRVRASTRHSPRATRHSAAPEVEMCRQELGILVIADDRYEPSVRAWRVVEFF